MTRAHVQTDFIRDMAANRAGDHRGRQGIAVPSMERMFDLEPPRALEAEMALLGAMLLEAQVCDEVILILSGPEAFYDPAHGSIYQAIADVWQKTRSGDLVQIKQHLEDRAVLADVGGMEYLEQLASSVPMASNAPHFARLVAEKCRLRKLIEACGAIVYNAYHVGNERDSNVARVLDAAEAAIYAVADAGQAPETAELKDLVAKEYERLVAISEGRANPMGIATGYYDLDEMLSGLQPGELVILAARPSMGKTALGMNIAEQLVTATDGSGSPTHRERVRVGLFSLEMSKDSITQRLLSSSSGIDSNKVRRGFASADELQQLAACADVLAEAPLFIDDTAGLSIMALRARARRMVHRHKVQVLIVDYLQLMTAPEVARESRQVEVSAISRGVKALARELKIPVICLSQLNRGPENRDQNRPRLSDLRESGSLEQDADVVLLLHREEYYHIGDTDWLNANPDKRGLAELIIAKQRNGPTGSVPLTWQPQAVRFRNASASPITAAANATAKRPAVDETPAWARPDDGEGETT